jgi:hypothetical protein
MLRITYFAKKWRKNSDHNIDPGSADMAILFEMRDYVWSVGHVLRIFSPRFAHSGKTPGLPDFSWNNIPKRENIPNAYKLYQMTIKIDQIAVK